MDYETPKGGNVLRLARVTWQRALRGNAHATIFPRSVRTTLHALGARSKVNAAGARTEAHATGARTREHAPGDKSEHNKLMYK